MVWSGWLPVSLARGHWKRLRMEMNKPVHSVITAHQSSLGRPQSTASFNDLCSTSGKHKKKGLKKFRLYSWRLMSYSLALTQCFVPHGKSSQQKSLYDYILTLDLIDLNDNFWTSEFIICVRNKSFTNSCCVKNKWTVSVIYTAGMGLVSSNTM